MIIKVFLLLLPGIISTKINGDKEIDTCVIQLEHLGYQDKPYYKMFFYTQGSSIDTSEGDHFFSFFQVTKSEFKNIKRVIESSELEGQTFINDGTYSFTVISNGNVKKFTTGYIEPIKTIFTGISRAVDSLVYKKELDSIFSQTLWRLGSK